MVCDFQLAGTQTERGMSGGIIREMFGGKLSVRKCLEKYRDSGAGLHVSTCSGYEL